MKTLLLCLALSTSMTLPMLAKADVAADKCFAAIQSELTKKEQGNDVITLQSITLEEGSDTVYRAYAWIEDKTDSKVWPFHTYWGAVVEKNEDSCKVQSLVFVEGNM